jgi:hypothetical protein
MGPRKTFLLLVTVVLTLSAGVVLGWVWTPLQKVELAGPGAHPGPRPWFDQLELTADQQAQMDKIWGDTGQQMQKLGAQRRAIEKQRDDAIVSLLTTDQRLAYDKINKDFWTERAALDKQRQSIFADSNAKSRALLSDSQKQTWDALTKQLQMRHHHGPMGLATQYSTTIPSNGEGHHD